MIDTMKLEVLTPDKKVVDTTTEYMRVLLTDGWWGILPSHAPMISHIHSGVVHYQKDKKYRYIALYQGTIEVKQTINEPTKVLILTSAAEEGEDLQAVQDSLEQQAARLEELAREADIEFKQIRLQLEKSLQKIEVSNMGL
jgi:F-type H+-transporting ATPase subunit epsilon